MSSSAGGYLDNELDDLHDEMRDLADRIYKLEGEVQLLQKALEDVLFLFKQKPKKR